MRLKVPIRPKGRPFDKLRPVEIATGVSKYSDGSVIIGIGDTRVLCTANIEASVPRFLRNSGQGWLTAEYGMLPGATTDRTDRESTRGKQTGRSMEIQRLIGRSLRQAVDMERIGERTIKVDCDVLQADGGTRTASITGACVALQIALNKFNPKAFKQRVAAVSVGIVQGDIRLDLEYVEDSNADSDLNVVMVEEGGLVEVQGTAEGCAFSEVELATMIELARSGIQSLFEQQRIAVAS